MIISFFRFRTLLYVIYAVLITIILLYFRFPASSFKLFCETGFERIFNVNNCKISSIKYQFPMTVRFTNIQFRENNNIDLALIDRLDITPKYSIFLEKFTIEGLMYGGKLTSELTLDHDEESFLFKDIQLRGVQLLEVSNSYKEVKRKISGELTLKGEYFGSFSTPLEGLGKFTGKITNCSFPLKEPILAWSELNIDKFEINIQYDDKSILLKSIDFSGKIFKGSLAGEIGLQTPLTRTNLSLQGSLVVNQEYLSKNRKQKMVVDRLQSRFKTDFLPFKIGGSIQTPTFVFKR